MYNSQSCGNSNILDCLKGLPEMTLQCPPGGLAEVVCGGELVKHRDTKLLLNVCTCYVINVVCIDRALLVSLFTGVSDMCSNGDVRLVSEDATDSQGRVEVCLGGEWGTVCDNSWDDRAATVICQQLRLPSEGETTNDLVYNRRIYTSLLVVKE